MRPTLYKVKDFLKHHLNSRGEAQAFYNWAASARPSQRLPLGNWRIWLILAGRGFGKTRTGAETLRLWATSGLYKNICLLGDTIAEGRRVMVEGPSGLLAISAPHEGVSFCPSKRQLVWPNGAKATLYGARSYNQLRGPQFDAAWIDELAKFPHLEETWHQLMLGLRLGPFPRVIITTTPRPLPFLRKLMQQDDVFVTTGNTFENTENLSQTYITALQTHYAHTRLGAQEVEGKILDDLSDTLWSEAMLEKALLKTPLPALMRVVVAIDPAVTHGAQSDETGLIVAGLDAQGFGYILEDLSGTMSATTWARKAVQAYHHYAADRIVAEVNNGGDLVEKLIRTVDPHVSYKAVRATRGKVTRAEPVAALYEQEKVFHQHVFEKLHRQLLSYRLDSSGPSPDRLDALVWALTELMLSALEEKKKKKQPCIWTI